MNPIHFDLTLIIQVIAFLILLLPVCAIIYIVVFVSRKQQQDLDIVLKLNRIIELLENDRK